VHGGEAGPSNNGHGLREPAASTSTLTGTP
jgi:hypothetical protein